MKIKTNFAVEEKELPVIVDINKSKLIAKLFKHVLVLEKFYKRFGKSGVGFLYTKLNDTTGMRIETKILSNITPNKIIYLPN